MIRRMIVIDVKGDDTGLADKLAGLVVSTAKDVVGPFCEQVRVARTHSETRMVSVHVSDRGVINIDALEPGAIVLCRDERPFREVTHAVRTQLPGGEGTVESVNNASFHKSLHDELVKDVRNHPVLFDGGKLQW